MAKRRQQSRDEYTMTDTESVVGEDKPDFSSSHFPTIKFSSENIKEAEELLPHMTVAALEKLKKLLELKADAVRRDLNYLQQNEHRLHRVNKTLEKQRYKWQRRKERTANRLELLRNNVCNIPGFNCKLFLMRGKETMKDTLRDQWIVKGEMIDRMEELVVEGMEEDDELYSVLEENETEWRKLMSEYLYGEEQIASAGRRLQDLDIQEKNYGELVGELEDSLKEKRTESPGDQLLRQKYNAAHVSSLRAKVNTPVPVEYTEEAIAQLIEDFINYMGESQHDLLRMRDTVFQVQGYDDVRQHSLAMLIHSGNIAGKYGLDRQNWANLQHTALRTTKETLEQKMQDLKDMISFKEDALKLQLEMNDKLVAEEDLTFTHGSQNKKTPPTAMLTLSVQAKRRL